MKTKTLITPEWMEALVLAIRATIERLRAKGYTRFNPHNLRLLTIIPPGGPAGVPLNAPFWAMPPAFAVALAALTGPDAAFID
jgi:hypothetical protein